MADEHDAIEAPALELKLGAGSFTVAPITIERLPAFARALRPIMPAVAELAEIEEGTDPSLVTDILLELVEKNGEFMIEAVAVAVATGKDDIPAARERVAKLNPADFVLLALPVVKVNADFFGHRLLPAVLPALAGLREGAKAMVSPGGGSTPSRH